MLLWISVYISTYKPWLNYWIVVKYLPSFKIHRKGKLQTGIVKIMVLRTRYVLWILITDLWSVILGFLIQNVLESNDSVHYLKEISFRLQRLETWNTVENVWVRNLCFIGIGAARSYVLSSQLWSCHGYSARAMGFLIYSFPCWCAGVLNMKPKMCIVCFTEIKWVRRWVNIPVTSRMHFFTVK